jgi:acetyltransferase-like isoleucine patch superfamily enzyme
MIGTTLRKYPCDWEALPMRDNIVVDPEALIDTAFSFDLCKSELPIAVSLARGSQVLDGTMLDVGPNGRVVLGECSMLNACWLIADSEIIIGDYTMFSWSVVVMDSYRMPRNKLKRREELQLLPSRPGRKSAAAVTARPIRIGNNVWVGFEACILPGVAIGDGAIVGARSTVVDDVPPYTVVAGNPARVVRKLERPQA